MVEVKGYYGDKSFLNCVYAIDIAVATHYANLLFDGDLSRIITAKNEYALFQRAKDTTHSDLNLPFFNRKETNNQYGLRQWWNAQAFTQGVYIPDVGGMVKARPMTISYDASFWCKRDDENQYAHSQVGWDNDNKTIFSASVTVNNQEVLIPCLLEYTDITWDPTYAEKDWLEQNNIHTFSASFDIQSFQLKTNYDITVTDRVIFEFANKTAGYTGDSYDDAFQIYLDSISGDTVISHITPPIP